MSPSKYLTMVPFLTRDVVKKIIIKRPRSQKKSKKSKNKKLREILYLKLFTLGDRFLSLIFSLKN